MFKAEIIGYIGSDAKIVNNNGNEFVSFSVAHSEKREEKEITTWVNVSTPSIKLSKYLTKGTKVFVRGNVGVRTYKNEQGATLASLNVYATEIEFCGGKKDDGNTSDNQDTSKQTSAQNSEQKSDKDESLPF